MGKISRDSLDDELAKAAGIDDDASPARSTASPDLEGAMAVPDPPEPHPEAPVRPRPGGSYRLLGTLLVLVSCIVALFMFGFQDAAVYSVGIDKVLGDGVTGRRVRIDGELVPGTLTKRDKPCEFRFKVKGADRVLDVHFPQCVVPDTFRDVPEGGVMVTAEGKLTKEGHFEASLLLAKCSSKYDVKTHKMSPDAVKAM